MANSVLTALVSANIVGGLAILVVLTLRLPARRLFGARIAYVLWLAVPLAMAACLLPARLVVLPAPVITPLPLPLSAMAMGNAITGLMPIAPVGGADLMSLPTLDRVLVALWLIGVIAWLIRISVAQTRSVARFGAITPLPGKLRLARAANAAVGPALIGILRPRLVLPADFATRFGELEQAMVLAHEQAHLSAGHVWINAATAALRAACWFNPLVHIAAAFAQVDQELACDAAVVARFPGERRTYAQALLKTQLDAVALPLGCAWPVGSPNLLMERLAMLTHPGPDRFHLAAGTVVTLALSAGAGVAAWAVQPPRVQFAQAPAASPQPTTGPAPAAAPARVKPSPAPAAVGAVLGAPPRAVVSTPSAGPTIRPGDSGATQYSAPEPSGPPAPVYMGRAFQADFDGDQPVAIHGKVTGVDWTITPGVPFIHILMTDDAGKLFRVQGGRPTQLGPQGRALLESAAGKTIDIRGYNGRDASCQGGCLVNARDVTFAGGDKYFFPTMSPATPGQPIMPPPDCPAVPVIGPNGVVNMMSGTTGCVGP